MSPLIPSFQVPKTKTATQTSYALHHGTPTADCVCVALAQMVSSGFLALSINDSQYTFSITPLPPMTQEEKIYAAIFGSTPLVIGATYNPLLKEFNTALKNQTPKSSAIKMPSKWLVYVGLISFGISFLSFKTLESKLAIARRIEYQLGEPVLITITAIFGIIALLTLGAQAKKLKGLNKYGQDLKNIVLLHKTLQTNPTANLSDMPIKQLFPYVMAISKDWDKLAHQAQHQPALQPLMDLCSNNFKKAVGQTLHN